MSKMFTDSEGCNLLSYKLIWKWLPVQFPLQALHNPFLFSLHLTSSVEKEFFFHDSD